MPTYGEITSTAVSNLPTADPTSWDLSGASGRFDREFRLLREDTAGQIRYACQDVLQAARSVGLDFYRRLRTSTYFDFCDDAKVEHIIMSKKHGIEFTVACKQPEPTRIMTDEQRQTWWEECKRFRPGTIVSVLDKAGVILHFVVSGSTLRGPKDAPDDFLMDSHKFNLSSGNEWSYVNLKLVESSKLGDALRWYRDTEPPRYLLDFPDLTLACFKDTLEALQRQCQSPHRLIDLLNPLDRPAVERPAYARAPGFEFNLDCLIQHGGRFQFRPGHALTTAEASSFAGLGSDQVNALLESLSNEVALVCGRPGTGKTYLARKILKALVHNREPADLGPIVCIFHNDAALDRMVHRLLADGIERIVRMGGRSESGRLQDLNLPLTHYAGMSRQERSAEKQTTKFHDKLISDIEVELLKLSDIDSPWQLEKFLSWFDPESHKEIFGPRRGDFSEYQPKTADAVQEWLLAGDQPLIEGNSRESGHVDATLLSERRSRYQEWLKAMQDRIIRELTRSYEEFEAIGSALPQYHDNARRQILQDAQIVAVTTTELAKHPELLQPIHAKVLVCDDAGEFLESQILTAILPSTEHIILIGDHNQLRPKVQTQKLQRTHPEGALNPLDVSLFERLLGMAYPLSTLPLQRRMRPSIAWLNRLVRDTAFGNDDLVMTFPDVVGMGAPLFWLDHRHTASSAGSIEDEDFSLDDFEIEMVRTMLNHLVRQGPYSKHDIAVITPSKSQLRQLLRRMKTEDYFTASIDDCNLDGLWEINPKEHAGCGGYNDSVSLMNVRFTTLDSFRGQEAKVVIIPLGRCTSQRALHSMRTSNRIDVLMSRARHGCYILGDSNAYKEDPVWRRIIETLEAGGNLGGSLELRCPRHPGENIRVSGPGDSNLASPDGGCSQPCGGQLDCGHDCSRSCHSNMMHQVTQCGDPCPRIKPRCGHACPLTCGESCEESCSQVMDDADLTLPCGHIIQSPWCWQVQDPAGVACEAKVDYKVPGCDHEVTVPCYKTDPQNPSFRCPATCRAALPCGHTCQRKCHECNFRYDDTFLNAVHDLCDQPCGKRQPDCAHSCQLTCHGDSECGPCQQECEVRCSHGKCDKLCHEPCLPCVEDNCASGCPHSKCTMPCAAPCNWVPCSRRCTKTLDCGHQCPSLCGEACPDSMYCQICGTEDILHTMVDLDMKDYRDVDLDEDPCVFPRCGHFQTKTSMDQQMGIQDFYNSEEDSSLSSIKTVQSPFSIQTALCCSQCQGSLRDISRYGRIIRRPMLDESLKALVVSSNGKFSELAGHLAQHVSSLTSNTDYRYTTTIPDDQDLLIKLNGNMQNQIHVLRDFVGEGRYADLANLYRDIQTFSRELSAKEEVFQKIADLIRRANENSEAAARSTGAIHPHEPSFQTGGDLLAMDLSLRCNIAVLADFLKLWKGEITTGTFPRPTIQLDMGSNFRGSQELIKRACETKRPLFAAQGHTYFSWFCGFARTLRVEPISALSGRSETVTTQFPVTDEELRDLGLQHITEASDIHASCHLTSEHLKDEISAARRLIESGHLDEGARTDWFTPVSWALGNTWSWYACDNGHPFPDLRADSRFLGQLRCMECGLIVADRGRTPEEGATPGVDAGLPSQGETLVEI